MANRGPDPPPFFFLFSYPRPAVLYFLLHAKNSWLFTLSSLREPEKPTPPSSWDGGSPSSNRFLTHEPRKHHVSLSINDFYGRPPFLFLPRGRKDLTGLLPLARPRKNEKIGRGRRASIDERAAKKRRTGGGAGGEGEEGGVGDSVTYAFGEVDTGSANCYN